jgi:predicted DNA-binding transcriptional regulator AlpA
VPATKSLPFSSAQRDTAIAAGEQLLPLRKVAEIVGLARSTINKNVAAGVFPRPVKPNRGRCSRWLASEIQAYIAVAVAARDRASTDVPAN